MTRLGLIVLSIALAGTVLTPARSDASRAVDARLQGIWAMSGRVTRSDHVRGEHAGQRVGRTWAFASTCAAGPCRRVTLDRQRVHGIDSLLLHRTSRGKLTGNGRFYVPLRCEGRTYQRGGIAYFRVRLTVRRAKVVQGTPFATAISAVYTNSRRVNRTPCPGSIGRDAGIYSGRLAGAVPSPPTAEFSSSVDAARQTVSFADGSRAAAGAKVARWRWDFGDPESGPSNVSKLENPSHHYRSSGSYTITLTVTDSNGLTTSLTRQITT